MTAPTRRSGVDLSVLVPLVAVHGLALGAAPFFVTNSALAVCALLYLFTGFGVTAGAHRLFTHRSYEPAPWLRDVLVVAFTLSAQGSLHRWVRDHHIHHSHVDRDGDPHSPTDGLLHAHLCWLWGKPPRSEARALYERWCRGLDDGRVGPWLRSGLQLSVLHLSVAGLLFAGGVGVESGGPSLAFAEHWRAGLSWVLWGVPVRIVMIQHATFAVNSATHRWGERPYATQDDSRNLAWVAAVALGEGWHNNHHHRPGAANQGFHRRGEFDLTFLLLLALGAVGAVKNLRVWRAERGTEELWFTGGGRARLPQVAGPACVPEPPEVFES